MIKAGRGETLPETLMRFHLLVDRIVYPKMLAEVLHEGDHLFLRWVCPEGTCNVTGKRAPWKGRKWRLSRHMVDGEVVGTAFMALLQSLEHEARECFKFDGVPVYDAHVDIHKLVALHKGPEGATLERAHTPPPVPSKPGCPKCGSTDFLVSRDMRSTRHCSKCNHRWLPSQDILVDAPHHPHP